MPHITKLAVKSTNYDIGATYDSSNNLIENTYTTVHESGVEKLYITLNAYTDNTNDFDKLDEYGYAYSHGMYVLRASGSNTASVVGDNINGVFDENTQKWSISQPWQNTTQTLVCCKIPVVAGTRIKASGNFNTVSIAQGALVVFTDKNDVITKIEGKCKVNNGIDLTTVDTFATVDGYAYLSASTKTQNAQFTIIRPATGIYLDLGELVEYVDTTIESKIDDMFNYVSERVYTKDNAMQTVNVNDTRTLSVGDEYTGKTYTDGVTKHIVHNMILEKGESISIETHVDGTNRAWVITNERNRVIAASPQNEVVNTVGNPFKYTAQERCSCWIVCDPDYFDDFKVTVDVENRLSQFVKSIINS